MSDEIEGGVSSAKASGWDAVDKWAKRIGLYLGTLTLILGFFATVVIPYYKVWMIFNAYPLAAYNCYLCYIKSKSFRAWEMPFQMYSLSIVCLYFGAYILMPPGNRDAMQILGGLSSLVVGAVFFVLGGLANKERLTLKRKTLADIALYTVRLTAMVAAMFEILKQNSDSKEEIDRIQKQAEELVKHARDVQTQFHEQGL